jgi:type II secretory pathway component PulJ
MMNVSGFSFIEIIIALAITGILGGFMFNNVFMAERSLALIERTTTLDNRAALINHQLGRDLNGACIPLRAKQKKLEKPKPAQEKSGTQAQQPMQAKETIENSEQENKNRIERIFESTSTSTGNLSELTFITHNPLQIRGHRKPLIARVTYTLEAHKEFKNAFTLMRAESSSLMCCNKDGKPRAYSIADNIKHFSIHYLQKQEEPQEQQSLPKNTSNNAKKSDIKKITFKKCTEWPEKKEQKSENNQEEVPTLPSYAIVTLTLWADENHQAEETYEFRYQLYPSLPITEQFITEK